MKSKIITHHAVPTREALKNVYDVCNKLFNTKDVFYTSKEVQELKKDKSNVFIP